MPFTKTSQHTILTPPSTVVVYEDEHTGAMHYHITAPSKENVFLVAFPTVPNVSDGRAHILEHLALCGSHRFPVKDPFFAMTRRSMATFMNAMTYSEKTVYPFASQDSVDYFNLLDVYLDAVFFPNLSQLDFKQEGWRVELADEKLSYQGVVFNEMKGAYTDPMRAIGAGLEAALLPDTTYAFDSGGDPLVIPQLSHQNLLDFHAAHYHPSQAVFMSYGDINPAEIQAVIEARVLAKLTGRFPRILPQLAPLQHSPKEVSIPMPAQGDLDSEYGFTYGWLVGENIDVKAQMQAKLVESALLWDAASPMAFAIENSGFGRPGSYMFLDSGLRQMAFYISMEGLRIDEVPRAKALIMDTLKKVAKDGISHERLEVILKYFEFEQREITGGKTPFGLNLLLEGLPIQMNGGNPLDAWDNSGAIASLYNDIKNPAFIKKLVTDLINNMARVDATIIPDATYFSTRAASEERHLAHRYEALSVSEKQKIIDENALLLTHQSRVVSNDCLPRIKPGDVTSYVLKNLPFEKMVISPGRDLYTFAVSSNGVAYASLVFDLNSLPESSWHLLMLYIDLISNVGLVGMDFAEADAWRSKQVPMSQVELSAATNTANNNHLDLSISFSARALDRDLKAICDVVGVSALNSVFTEQERIQYLIESTYDEVLSTLAENGGEYARLEGASIFSELGHFNHCVEGLAHIKFLKDTIAQIQTPQGMLSLVDDLTALHSQIVRSPSHTVVACENDKLPSFSDYMQQQLCVLPHAQPEVRTVNGMRLTSHKTLAFRALGQVNHCYQFWRAPSLFDSDAPILSVLANLLSNCYLHTAVREKGGAYGGRAKYSPDLQTFYMASFRDPRFSGTFSDFDTASTWINTAELSQKELDEAIISTLSSMDTPASPYGQVQQALMRHLKGVTPEVRQVYRDRVRGCTLEDIKNASQKWLNNQPYTRTAFLGAEHSIPEANQMEFPVVQLEFV